MAKVITIAQQKGGAGKTTIAAHLAVAFSQRGKRVAIIDIDPQGSLTAWHKLRETRLGEGYTGLTFHAISGWRVSSEVTSLKRTHDVIIVDSPPHTETEAKTAIRAADMLVVPVQPSPTDVWATKATLDLAAKERIPAYVLLNRVTPNSKMVQALAAELPNKLEHYLGNRVVFASALLEGKCVTETAPSSPASLEVKALTQEINMLAFPEEGNVEAPKKTKKEKVLEEA